MAIIESIQLIIHSRKRTRLIVNFLKRFISKRGKALGKKEWKKIKKVNPKLYEILLSDKCKYSSVFYSLEIAKIITDSILIWGAITKPFEKGTITIFMLLLLEMDISMIPICDYPKNILISLNFIKNGNIQIFLSLTLNKKDL